MVTAVLLIVSLISIISSFAKSVKEATSFSVPLMIVVMALLTVPALTTKKLHRWQGIVLLCIYAAFCAIQFGL